MSKLQLLRYEGEDRDGAEQHGVVSGVSAGTLVETKYRGRWRSLIVRSGDGNDVVGEIMRHPDTGRRVWWAEL